ncbi:glycosyltransferase family 4 protein [Spirosoma fluminis]
MNILIAAVSRYEKPSGICRSAANQANSLATHSEVSRVYLAVADWQVNYYRSNLNIISDRIEIVPISMKNAPIARNWWYLTGLPALAKKLKCSLVHLSFPAPTLRWLYSVPVVSTVNDFYPFEFPENFGYPQVYGNQLFARICIANSDGIVSISQHTLDQFKKYFPKYKSPKTLIYPSVDFKDIEASKPRQLSLQGPYLLSVAQHRKNKNLDLLIQAFYETRESGTIAANSSLLIVGSNGSETESLHQLVHELKILDKVYFLSALNDSELTWLYQNCHIMVLPSSVEGLGLPVVEALYNSARVICSDIPTLREVGEGQCQFFSLQGDVLENLKFALAHTWKSSDRTSIKDPRFDMRIIANQFVSFYRGILLGSTVAIETTPPVTLP